MQKRADGNLSNSESEVTIVQPSRDVTGASMIHGLATATGSDHKLGREKTGKKRHCEEDAAEGRLCPCSDGGSHLGAAILAGTSPMQSSSAAMEPQPSLTSLPVGDSDNSSVFTNVESLRRLQMGNVPPLAGSSSSQELYQSVRTGPSEPP
ncbi:UNVERIFIED_CONTAM: hypothetical protein K2H54_074528 [Gekko kuhli]